jgi:hypothetical protein
MVKPKRIRDLIFRWHRLLGLMLGILIAIAGLTGSAMIVLLDTQEYFTKQEIESIIPQGDRLSLETLIDNAKASEISRGYPIVTTIEPYTFPNQPQDSPTTIYLSQLDNAEKSIQVLVNPYTGKVLGKPPSRDLYDAILNLHHSLLGGEVGTIMMGVTGLLGFVLMVTGIALWSGWRKLSTGLKIKWNGHIKRRNFGIHQVGGIFSGVFLSMALITGFIYNFPRFTYPLIYRLTFSPIPVEEFVSTPIPSQSSIDLAQALQAIDLAMPQGIATQIDLPQKTTDVYKVRKKVPGDWYGNPTWGRSFVNVDRYSGICRRKDRQWNGYFSLWTIWRYCGANSLLLRRSSSDHSNHDWVYNVAVSA